uniref:Tryptophan synthase alpha chain n=1 Tax=Boldia erythrosiphon TaxID=74908 RepID=A0A1Y9TM13_9RHOD|nr:tryptophan synthase alpha subunit [Boldia erythrosiphon]ARO90658.1 tryptophan synthase alpha subunit [Boldia erythrosiphon]
MTISISNTFKKLKNQCAFIPFITAGDPNLEITELALKILDNEQADIIEIGIPYSDSLADGPIIQAAAERALRNGITINQILELIEKIIPQISAPIIIFSYYNIILNYGIKKFIVKLRIIGIKGLVIPDLPIEESKQIVELCDKNMIELVLLIAPTSSVNRIKKIVVNARGCLYLVSTAGVTGIKKELRSDLKNILDKIHQISKKPIIIGFGISNPEQAKQVKLIGSNGIVIGSTLVDLLSRSTNNKNLDTFQEFCKSIKEAIN